MAAFFAFYMLGINSEQALNLRPGSGTWLPIGVLVLIGIGRALLARQADHKTRLHA